MRVLIACEYSGIVRDAFIAKGHDALSCDLLPSERPGPHYQGNVLDILDDGWDMMIAHPPCTHLAVSGARWFKDKEIEQEDALEFVRDLLDAPLEKIALENPVSIISSRIRPPTQYIQPWQFGHPEMKKTGLWLKNLPKLKPTMNVHSEMMTLPERERNRVWLMSPSENRWIDRSRTFEGVAEAMANQWG